MTVTVTGLTITTAAGAHVLDQAVLSILPSRITALTGPSGTGKTTLLRAVIGDLAPGLTRTHGSVRVLGHDVFTLSSQELRELRRHHVAFVGQDPGSALNPTMRVSTLLAEVAPGSTSAALAETLELVRLGPGCLRRRPGELSGGEQRRVALARALIRNVGVLLIDEPFAGLDALLRKDIAELLRKLAAGGTAIAVTGHDTETLLGVADDVTSLGEHTPIPAIPRRTVPSAAVALAGTGLTASVGRTPIVREVDITAHHGGTAAIVGASGAGKTTLARVLVGLHQDCCGVLELHGRPLALPSRRRARADRRRIQLVPQNPLSTLNPARTIGATLDRPLRIHQRMSTEDRPAGIRRLLADVGLPGDFARRYPHELSGGQRQRIAIARALAAGPEVLVCDEITSALDEATAESIMLLLRRAQEERALTLVVISHDLRLVERHCDTVFVLHKGELVECGDIADVFARPSHAITAALLT